MSLRRSSMQLHDAVDRADHYPFASDAVEAASEELSEVSGLFDVAEYGLDDLLA